MDELSIVGVGLLPSRNDTKRHMGHMWLRWYDDKEGKFQYRGYYPVVADIPPDIADSELRKYFCNKGVKVRGCYMDDIEARESEESMNKHQYLVKCWDILGEQYDMVLQDCFLLEDEIFVVSGFYSCDEDIDDADNCSSWAIKKLIKAKDNKFIACKNPKRLKHVEEALCKHIEEAIATPKDRKT